MPTSDIPLRAAGPSDATAIAVLHRRAFEVNLPWLPTLHSPEQDRDFFMKVVQQQQVLVVERSRLIAGFAAWSKGWLNHLYVDPEQQRQRVGQTLLDAVIDHHRSADAPSEFQLWTFQRNYGARRFYEVNGLVPLEFTPGNNNEEQEPDIRYVWRRASS